MDLSKHRLRMRTGGFTLSEMLIALAILGVIATFTIPKVLQNQQDSKFKSIAKEAIAMSANAYEVYKLHNQADANTDPNGIYKYTNYIKDDTSSVIDSAYGLGSATCSAANPCIRLHNGAMVIAANSPFGGTGSTSAILFGIDPDGVYSSTTNGPGKALGVFLYFSGRVTTWGNALPNTIADGMTYNPAASRDPDWFSWD